MDYKNEIIKMLRDKYGWSEEEIINTDDFQELGLDSLSVYSLITDIEEMSLFLYVLRKGLRLYSLSTQIGRASCRERV